MSTRPDADGASAADAKDTAKHLPADADKGSEDGALESIGKAIAAPVEGAAAPEEPSSVPHKPPVPPG